MDLAFQWAGGNILAFCEIDNYCQKVLRKHWPDVHIFNDIHNLNKEVLRNEGILQTVDVIYGGFPCQPFSVAGNKKGKNDARYLWPEFSRLVRDFRPRWIVAENVPGILSLAADDVCTDLEYQGYEVGIWDFEAAAVGTKHRRERIFLWRTPDAHCYRGASSKERYKMKLRAGLPISLNDQVAHLLPTPTANDAKNNGNPSRQNRHSPGLNGVAGGSLNPNWVEALMGFPQNWTEV